MTIESRAILGSRIDAPSYAEATSAVLRWAATEESRYVCVAPVSTVMEAYDDGDLRAIVDRAALVTPDGMPVVWALRLLGLQRATRIYGPDLTPMIIEAAEREGIPVGFYGGSPQVLQQLVAEAFRRFPCLKVGYAFSPPFRPLTEEEDCRVTSEIVRSQAKILFVGIGSPKQELWMAAHVGRIPAVMLGVGAAFDFLAGAKPQAPRWMMRIGMEWFFRLATEPRRLWKRYLKHNPRFVMLFALQLLGLKKFPSGSVPRV